jgi:hypothetical protein
MFMPKRTNFFQHVVALLHEQIYPGATVSESEMLIDRGTGASREVDVVIRPDSPYEIVVSIEATSRSAPATVEWVEQMHGKHRELPTDRLILVSDSGFTPEALKKAEHIGVLALSPSMLEGELLESEVGKKVAWLTHFSFLEMIGVESRVRVRAITMTGQIARLSGRPTTKLFVESSSTTLTLSEYLEAVVASEWSTLVNFVDVETFRAGEMFEITGSLPQVINIGDHSARLLVDLADFPNIHMTGVGVVIEMPIKLLFRAERIDVDLAPKRLGEVATYSATEMLTGAGKVTVVMSSSGDNNRITTQIDNSSAPSGFRLAAVGWAVSGMKIDTKSASPLRIEKLSSKTDSNGDQ